MLAAALLMTVLPSVSPAPADDDGVQREDGWPAEVKVGSHAADDGKEYGYLWIEPPTIEVGKRYPLIVFLHGAGERGDDPRVLLKHFFPPMLSDEYRRRFPCFILAPQCPTDGRWANKDWRAPENADGSMAAPMKAASELLRQKLKANLIDDTRLYLTGLSMGGYGTWDWAARQPELWAAAAPICGGGDPKTADRLKDLPLWVAHGDADPTVSVKLSREMVAAVSAAGGSPIYVEYPGVDHFSWTPAYGTPDGLPAWLFRQRKGE
ncbi:MAG: phospholipase [Planctomycetota bacterium]